MKMMKTGEIYHLSPFDNSMTWFWGMDYTSGDLYEAAQLYQEGHPVNKNRAVFVRYPEGILIEPVIAKEGQYLGTPSFFQERIYTLLVDFPKEEIQLLSFDPEKVLKGCGVDTVTVLPLDMAQDCYNLIVKSSPVMLTRQTMDNHFQILWTEKDGITDVSFPMEDHESFSHAEGDKLYFNNWWEAEDPVYEYHEETIVRNLEGEILERMDGGIFEISPGEYWVLK